MKWTKSIPAFLLIGTLLFSSAGFSVNRHYCMGMLIEENFFHLPEECSETDDRHCSGGQDHLSKKCCENEQLLVEGIDILTLFENSHHTLPQSFTVTTAPGHLLTGATFSGESFKNFYRPPPGPLRSGTDLLVWEQCFRI